MVDINQDNRSIDGRVVSYDLYMGTNSIGTEQDGDVVLLEAPEVQGHHATITALRSAEGSLTVNLRALQPTALEHRPGGRGKAEGRLLCGGACEYMHHRDKLTFMGITCIFLLSLDGEHLAPRGLGLGLSSPSASDLHPPQSTPTRNPVAGGWGLGQGRGRGRVRSREGGDGEAVGRNLGIYHHRHRRKVIDFISVQEVQVPSGHAGPNPEPSHSPNPKPSPNPRPRPNPNLAPVPDPHPTPDPTPNVGGGEGREGGGAVGRVEGGGGQAPESGAGAGDTATAAVVAAAVVTLKSLWRPGNGTEALGLGVEGAALDNVSDTNIMYHPWGAEGGKGMPFSVHKDNNNDGE
ncbi:unnamed protein product, partial [Discosporangium mesarthrocarpum]